MDEVVIDSVDGRSLTLRNRRPPDADEIWSYDVSLNLESGSVTTRVWDSGQGLAAFFRALALEPPRFDGDREFATFEGELVIRAHAEGLGHVQLDVGLGHPSPPSWSLDAVLAIGAGAHVERIARELEQFCAPA